MSDDAMLMLNGNVYGKTQGRIVNRLSLLNSHVENPVLPNIASHK
jgi:hypothetical protein